jgi:DNA topoisomerase-2
LKFKKEDLGELVSKGELEHILKLTDTSYTNYSNMHMYSSKEVITKYETPEEILNDFYLIRLAFYIKRKEYMLKSMKRELDIIKSKIRFIEEFINGDISILHKEDEEIYKMLEDREYPKFGKEDDNDENDESEFNYEYLLNMKIKSLTKKKIEELKSLFDNKQALFNDLELKSEKDLWRDDLNNFIELYRKKLKEYNEKSNDTKVEKKINKTIKIKAVKK